MNILLWILQSVVAVYCVMGSLWRFSNYEQASKQMASLAALPYSAWNVIGLFEVVCGLGLVLPGVFKVKPSLTPIFATCLVVEMALLTALHLKYFSFEFRASNPAVWTGMLAILSAFIAYGRFSLRPL